MRTFTAGIAPTHHESHVECIVGMVSIAVGTRVHSASDGRGQRQNK